MLESAQAVVDPFGSESFGLAVLTGKASGGDATVSYICIMDKQTGTVELGSELPADVLSVTAEVTARDCQPGKVPREPVASADGVSFRSK